MVVVVGASSRVLSIFICVCVCLCVLVRVCMCMFRPEFTVDCHFQPLFSLVLETESLSKLLSHWLAKLVDQKPPGILLGHYSSSRSHKPGHPTSSISYKSDVCFSQKSSHMNTVLVCLILIVESHSPIVDFLVFNLWGLIIYPENYHTRQKAFSSPKKLT